MMRVGLIDALYHERKRLALVTLLAFAAGCLFYAHVDISINGIPVAIITGVVYALVVAPAAVLICLFLPSLRFMIEAVAVSRLILSVFVYAAPGLGMQILASPLLTATLVVMGGALVSRVIHSNLKKDTYGLFGGVFERRRAPARVAGAPWQHRFVGWVDDAVPVPVPVR